MAPIVVVTGAASGIGRGTVQRLLDRGSTVIALDLNESGLGALQCDFASCAGALHTQTCDVASEESVKAAFAEIAIFYSAETPVT